MTTRSIKLKMLPLARVTNNMLAASYNFGPVAVGAGYDRTKFFNDDVRKTWRVTAAAPITANDTVGLSYSRGKVDIDAGETYDAKGWGLSYSHAMSKRTNVYSNLRADEPRQRTQQGRCCLPTTSHSINRTSVLLLSVCHFF